MTTCGVTLQAQNTGNRPCFISGGSPKFVRLRSPTPRASGRPRCTGAPCTAGKREVICTARMASAGVSGRIDTTILPLKLPAGTHSMLVRYIGTTVSGSICCSGIPACRSGSSNVGTDVDVAKVWQSGVARRAKTDQRAGSEIALTEGSEIEGQLLRHDAQITLHVLRCNAGGLAGGIAGPHDGSRQGRFVNRQHAVGVWTGAVAELVENQKWRYLRLELKSQNRRLAAAKGDNANDDRYSKPSGW
jgi:hypothetical protein